MELEENLLYRAFITAILDYITIYSNNTNVDGRKRNKGLALMG